MQQREFVLEVAHHVHYSNRNPVPISEIASSLLALERILLRTPRVMTLVTSVPIEHIEIYVEDISSGSLAEEIIVKLFFKDQESLDAFLLKINEKLGQHKVTRNVLLGALILGVVGAGLYGAAKFLGATDATKVINVNNNVIINIAAKETGLLPEQLEKLLTEAITDKKTNAKDAIEFVRPAKRDPDASITLENSTVLVIPKEVVEKTPSNLVIEATPSERFVPDVDLQIRATNLDSQKSGWAGIIPMLVDRRVKLVLADGIDPGRVAGKFTVRADVIVHSQPTGPKQKILPHQITLVRLIEENPAATEIVAPLAAATSPSLPRSSP